MKKNFTLAFAALMAFGSPAMAQWNTKAEAVTLASTDRSLSGARVAFTSDGKMYMSYTEGTDDGFKLYLQLFDQDGNKLFGDEGLLVDGHKSPSWRSDYTLCVTSDDCAVLTFADSRAEEGQDVDRYRDFQPVIYKISQNKEFLFGEEGITFPQWSHAPLCKAYVNGNDIYVMVSSTEEGNEGTFLNRINPDGTLAWSEFKTFAGQLMPSVGTDMLAIYSSSDGAAAQRYTRDFEPVWSEPTVFSTQTSISQELIYPYAAVSDGQGGAALSFVRNMGNFSHMVEAAYVDADGNPGFGLNSVPVYSIEEYDHDYCMTALNQANKQILVTWCMNDGTANYQGQRFSFSGERQWGDKGKNLANKSSDAGYDYTPYGLASMSNGDWLMVYGDDQWYGHSNAMATRLTADGDIVWTLPLEGDVQEYSSAQLATWKDCSYLIFERDRDDYSGSEIKAIRFFHNGTFDNKPTAINNVPSATAANGKVQYFSIDGQRLDAPQRGINIVRNADGSVAKVAFGK